MGATQDKELRKSEERKRHFALMEKVYKMFAEMDKDGSQMLSLEELHGAPQEVQDSLADIIGSTMSPEDIFRKLDWDGNGELSIEEFCEGIMQAGSGQPMEFLSIIKLALQSYQYDNEIIAI